MWCGVLVVRIVEEFRNDELKRWRVEWMVIRRVSALRLSHFGLELQISISDKSDDGCSSIIEYMFCLGRRFVGIEDRTVMDECRVCVDVSLRLYRSNQLVVLSSNQSISDDASSEELIDINQLQWSEDRLMKMTWMYFEEGEVARCVLPCKWITRGCWSIDTSERVYPMRSDQNGFRTETVEKFELFIVA